MMLHLGPLELDPESEYDYVIYVGIMPVGHYHQK
jgi:hypothetical protein